MPRPKRSRRICKKPDHMSFSPDTSSEDIEVAAQEEELYENCSGMPVWFVEAAKNYSWRYMTPSQEGGGEKVILSLDEYETIRLVDYEKQTHSQCAAQMDISRTTVTEIYESARQKVADCLVNGKRLIIEGGDYRFCDGSADYCCKKTCDTSEIRKEQKQ